MYHLYMKAKEATERGAPPEVRILKHLVSISDPQHRASELENSFKPVRTHRPPAPLTLFFRAHRKITSSKPMKCQSVTRAQMFCMAEYHDTLQCTLCGGVCGRLSSSAPPSATAAPSRNAACLRARGHIQQ